MTTAAGRGPQEDVAAGPRGYRTLLGNREFLGLLISRLISLVGDQLARVALTVLVFARTGSPLLSAATYAVTFLPVVIGGPLLGGLADRLPRRRLLVIADLLRAGLLALMAVPGLPLAVLLALVLLATTVEGPWAAARAPLMRDVLIDDDGYQLGTGLDEALNESGQVLGFALAGALLVVFSTGAALLLDAVSFAASAVAVRLLVGHHAAADADGSPSEHGRGGWARRYSRMLSDARLGLSAATGPLSRRPLLLTWAGISCSIAPEALAAPWGRSLGAGTLGVGLLYAAAPAGVVVGLLLVGRSSVERGQRLLLPLAVLALAPLLVCLADPPLPVALGLVVLSGVGISYSLLARVAFVRAVTGPQRGRAFAVAAAGVTAGQGLGIALAGAAASLTSPSFAVGLLGALGLVLVAAVVVATAPSRASGVAGGEPSPAAATVRDGVASIGAWVPPDS